MDNITVIKAITGVDCLKATELLELSKGDIEKAVDIYLNELNEPQEINNTDKLIDINDYDNLAQVNNIDELYEIDKQINELDYDINFNQSLYDNNISNSFKSNLFYMKSKYYFKIPYEEYLLNLHDLFEYLYKEVYFNNQCLWCGKKFINFNACQHHMLDKDHTMINFDLIENLEKYYNLSSIKEIYIDKESYNSNNDLILNNGNIAVHKDMADYYNRKNRIQLSSTKNIDQLMAQQLARKECLKNFDILNTGMKYNKKAIASQFTHKSGTSFNKTIYAEKHHWGAGGGGSHYNMAASKQQLKGVNIKNIKQRRGGKLASKNHQSAKQNNNYE